MPYLAINGLAMARACSAPFLKMVDGAAIVEQVFILLGEASGMHTFHKSRSIITLKKKRENRTGPHSPVPSGNATASLP
jgi:hypothetical protein